MTAIAKRIWDFLWEKGTTITASWIPSIENRTADWTQTVKDQNDEIKDQQRMLRLSEEDIIALTQQLRNLSSEKTLLETSILDLSSRNDFEKESITQIQQDHQEKKYDEKKKRISALENLVKVLEARIRELEELLDKAENTRHSLEEREKTFTNKIQRIEKELKEEQDNIQLKNNHILQLTKDIQSLNQQLLEAQENERIKDEELNTSQVECNDLRYKLRSRKDNKSQTIQDFEGIQSLAKRYKEERDQAKTTIKSMKMQLGSCKREVEKLNKTNAHEPIKALRSDVKSKGTMLAKSRGDVNVVSQWLKDEHGITWPTGIKMKELKAKCPKAKMDKGLEEEIATSEQEFQQVLTEQNEAVASIPSTVNRVETMEWSDLSNSSSDEDDDLPPPLPIKSKENVNPPETNLEKKITELVQVLSQKRDDEDQLELSINRLEGSERETNYKVRPNDLPKFDGKNTKAGYASNITEFLEKCHTKAALGKIPLDFMAAMMTERIEGNIKLRFNIWRKGQLENSDDWALTWNNFSEWLKDKAMSETSRKMKKATLASLKQGKKT